jgi:hypothetical protein
VQCESKCGIGCLGESERKASSGASITTGLD